MSSLTGLFKRPRSKSEKALTPSKVVFGDLGTAYASIAQKNTPSTPNLRRAVAESASSPIETNAAWSSVQSPQSEVSPSAPLLSQRSPDVIRVSHLSGDLFLPKDFDNSPSKSKFSQAFDPFSFTGQDRSSSTTLDFKKHVLDGFFGTNAGEEVESSSEDVKEKSPRETKLLSSSEYPELKEGQLVACSKLSGADIVHVDDGQPLDRCGTIQSLSKRHPYGQVGSNDDIHSVCGSHVKADDTDEEREVEGSKVVQQDTVEQVEWSPRSSLEVFAPEKTSGPPAIALPQTPQGKGISRYRGLQEFSSPTEQVSRSSESYGNTRRLLELSFPQFPRPPSQGDSFFKELIDFAKEGPSSSSHGDSNKSFATFSIEEADGNLITRPVSQGEFQHLENAISSHLRRESQASNVAAGADYVHVGQISLRFPEGSEADRGPGSSQTTSSSEFEPDVDYSVVQPVLRTRNGTPPLLFGSSSRSKRDADWETVGDSSELTSSIADYSDSASRSPPKSLLFVNSGKMLKHPAHPRYNHSWDLQQDVRSGAYVLTPHYKLSGGSSFSHNNAVAPLALRKGLNNYSHPTPLTTNHCHPFASPAPQIGPSRSAGVIELSQHNNTNNTGKPLGSQASSAWTTTGDSSSRAATSFARAHDSSAVLQAPPLPVKNPSRLLKKPVSAEQIELQSVISSRALLAPGYIQDNSSNMGPTLSTMMNVDNDAQGPLIKQLSNQSRAASTGITVPSSTNGSTHRRTGEAHNEKPRDNSSAQIAPYSHGSKDASSDKEQLLNSSHDGVNDHGRFGDTQGVSTGAHSVSSYATTNEAPLSTLPAGPAPLISGTDASGVTRPANLRLAEPRNSPRRHARADSITTEQVEYLHTRPADWEPSNAELPYLIRPLPRLAIERPDRFEPRPFVPEPHPLDLGPRVESPHLYPRLAIKIPWTYEQRVARFYLGVCGLFPVLLLPYIFGWLDIVMRVHTRGQYRAFPRKEKRMAIGVLIVWLILVACVTPVMAISRSAWLGKLA
ncbi:MAG: hypothetical protein Q9225_001312 [Loekoesia sp. 1 TL-2023]